MKTKNKTSKAFLLIILMFIGFSANTFAQAQTSKKEKIEALKVAYITKMLNLTTEEAQNFWPVYNENEIKKKDINKGTRNDNLILKQGSIEELTDAEAEQLINRQIIQAQKILDLRKEYLVKLKKVLPIKKIVMLYQAERKFKNFLSDEIQDRKQNNKGQRNNRENFRNKD